MQQRLSRILVLALVALLACACTTTTNLTSTRPDTQLQVKSATANAVPRSETLNDTTFGNYEFRAERPGAEPFYGRLPLNLSGTNMALDILFFAPAMFMNLRTAFKYYDFDLDQRLVRFRNAAKDPWQTYTPNDIDVLKARSVFGAR